MKNTAHFLLRAGLAFTFIYAGIAGFLNPDAWIGYFPDFLRILPENILLPLWSIVEIVLGLWLLSGWKIKISAALATLSFLLITLFNLSVFDVVFRDIGLAAASAALFFMERTHTRERDLFKEVAGDSSNSPLGGRTVK